MPPPASASQTPAAAPGRHRARLILLALCALFLVVRLLTAPFTISSDDTVDGSYVVSLTGTGTVESVSTGETDEYALDSMISQFVAQADAKWTSDTIGSASAFTSDYVRKVYSGDIAVEADFPKAGAYLGALGLEDMIARMLELLPAEIDAALEEEWDIERLLQTGERIWNLERQFNLAAGLAAADDGLPPRLQREPAPSGAARGEVCHLDSMLPAYYQVRGWDEAGIPLADTLARLALN